MNLTIEAPGEGATAQGKSFNQWLHEFWTTGAVEPDLLLKLSQSLAFRAGTISARCPVTDINEERDALLHVASQAVRLGAWMLHAGIECATHLGPFGPRRPSVGEKVRIRKGAVVNFAGDRVIDSKTLVRVRTVKVGSMADWSVDWSKIASGDPTAIRETDVSWEDGDVRYWTCITNVETMDQAKTPGLLGKPWRLH